MAATELEPTTTWFVNEHSTIWPNWLAEYSFSKKALTPMCSYLKSCKQRVAINNSANTKKTVAAGIPKGSINDPLLFSIFINDPFLFIQYTILGNFFFLLVQAVRNILRNCCFRTLKHYLMGFTIITLL